MDINLPQILFQLINFSVVVGAVSYLLYKPVLKILEERANRIEEAQAAARKTIEEKERLNEVEKNVIRKAEKQAAKIVDDARKAAKEAEATSLKKAKDQAKKEIAKAQADWESERKKYIQQIRSEYTAAVISSAGKVLGAELDKKKHEKLISDQLKSAITKIEAIQ